MVQTAIYSKRKKKKKKNFTELTWLRCHISEAASTSQSNEAVLSGGNDGPDAAMRESNPSHSEKAETER